MGEGRGGGKDRWQLEQEPRAGVEQMREADRAQLIEDLRYHAEESVLGPRKGRVPGDGESIY